MTKEETGKLLQMMRAAYPNAKIVDPGGTIDAWMLAFGDVPAEVVYKAARVHLKKNKFFPTVADLQSNFVRGELCYGGSTREENVPKLAEPESDGPMIMATDADCIGSCICPYYGTTCNGTQDEMKDCNL